MDDFVICVRNTRKRNAGQEFGNEPGPTKFLKVPEDRYPEPSQAIKKRDWVEEVIDDATTGKSQISGKPTGDVLVFIHGYNNSQEIVLDRHRRLKQDLATLGYGGSVVSYDWPSAACPLNYMEDRDDAEDTARRLRDDCISLFSSQQAAGCEINVHLLGHSTGAFVIREAFTDADKKTPIKNRPWKVSQIALIGADISSRSMSESSAKCKSLYRHCVRLTNYQNPFDSVLKLSNVKRIGVSPRAGRIGLPDDASEKAVNVNCGYYFKGLREDELVQGVDYYGSFDHSWHLGDMRFTEDLMLTIAGDTDRNAIPTREFVDGELRLFRV